MSEYVDNKFLFNEFVKWKEELKNNPDLRMPETIGESIMKIANGFINYWRFSRYTDTWKELMVGDAIEVCIKYAKNFDPEKYNNAHAYLTMICARAFFARINREKEKEAAKYKYFIEHVYDENDEDLTKLVDIDFYNDMANKVYEFEAGIKKPVKKEKVQPIGVSWLEEEPEPEVIKEDIKDENN